MESVFDHQLAQGQLVVRPRGEWTIDRSVTLQDAYRDVLARLEAERPAGLVLDLSRVGALDTAGGYFLARMERSFREAGLPTEWRGADKARAALLDRVRHAVAEDEPPLRVPTTNLLQDVGETVLSVSADGRRLLDTLGGVMAEFGRTLRQPSKFRAAAVVNQMEMAGLRAVPIVMLMSFLIGGIIAQQGAFQLRFFGAALFTVDLVGILSLREICVILTAIMVAGRSGSAITAELGSMKMQEEVDALRVMGLDPVNVLVVPRITALIIVLPLLTFLSALATLGGAMLTLWLYVDIPPTVFVNRLNDAIDFTSLLSGLFKAPFMALIIGLIACTEGMAVRGSAESLGRHTTAAVVKSIFMVIVVDGIFAIFYGAINF